MCGLTGVSDTTPNTTGWLCIVLIDRERAFKALLFLGQ